ncbi:MAG: hypothetical protein ACM3Q2_05580 [Syntrophothermus sp.]
MTELICIKSKPYVKDLKKIEDEPGKEGDEPEIQRDDYEDFFQVEQND